MSNVTKFIKANAKTLAGSITAAATTVATGVTAFAEGETVQNAPEILGTSLQGVVTDFIGYVAVVLPIGLTIFGTIFGVKKAMAFFRTVAK